MSDSIMAACAHCAATSQEMTPDAAAEWFREHLAKAHPELQPVTSWMDSRVDGAMFANRGSTIVTEGHAGLPLLWRVDPNGIPRPEGAVPSE